MNGAAQFSLPTVQIITKVLPINDSIKIMVRHPNHVNNFTKISTAWVTVLSGLVFVEDGVI